MQSFLRTWQEHWFVNNPAQCPAQSKVHLPHNMPPNSRVIFFFLHPTRKPTNLKVRYLIQVTESLIFTTLEIDIFCAVQETSRMFLMSYESKKVFVFSSFYCNMICFTTNSVLNNNSSSHIPSLTAYFLPVFS